MPRGPQRSHEEPWPAPRVVLAVSAALCTLACTGAVEGGPVGSTELVYSPGPSVFPRLTAPQYRASIEAALGAEAPAVPLEADTNPYLFYNVGASTTTLSELGAQQYEEAAHALAAWALDPARRDASLGCAPAAPGDACVRAFIARVGRVLYRRSLEPGELDRFTALSVELGASDAWQGARFALAGLLMSPSFVYRVEVGAPDPGRAGWRRYTSIEMASRLSFLLWNGPPDAELLDAAERGELTGEGGIYLQASRMLEDPRARPAIQSFFAQYLDLGRLEGIERDPMRYPSMTPTLARSMRTEVELLVDDIVLRRDADLMELFTTRRTFVNRDLATLYGVTAEGATAIAFVPVELPADGPRAGLLTLGAFLAMNAHPTETSPTLRGKYVRERLLCDQVPPPPDDVPELPPAEMTMPRTLRERLAQHRSDPFCASCHAAIDPPGLLFENFDSIGAFRPLELGMPVDTSGAFEGVPLRDGRDLGPALVETPGLSRCMVRQLYRHANGRLELPSEEPAIDRLTEHFRASGHRFLDLLLDLATSEAFRTTADPDLVSRREGGGTP